MKKLLLSLSLLAAGAAVAFAGPVEDRQAIMKERAGILKKLAPMAQGKAPYDAAEALTLLQALNANATKATAKELFPEGSGSKKAGDGNEASPKIWTDWAGFQATWDKYDQLVAAAVADAPKDQASLMQHFGAIGGECGTCHKAYRVDND